MTTGLEVRLEPGRERAELQWFTHALDEIIRALREIDQIYLVRGSRPTWVLAGLDQRDGRYVVRIEARPGGRTRSTPDMLTAVSALTDGAAELHESSRLPPLFQPATVTRIGELAQPSRGMQAVSLARYNGVVDDPVLLSHEVHVNALEAVRPYEISYGSVRGVLDLVGTPHRRAGTRLTIFDKQSGRAVEGHGPDGLGEQLRELWRHRVVAAGKIKRNSNGQPIRIDIDSIEALPEDDGGRPSVEDVTGADPEWLGGQEVDDYIADVRDG